MEGTNVTTTSIFNDLKINIKYFQVFLNSLHDELETGTLPTRA